jgi:hypothetical protein
VGCEKLETITFEPGGSGITGIGADAFRLCSALERIDLPASVITIGSSAFYYCGNLTGITLPDSLVSIGADVFYDCINLEQITLPAGIVIVPGNAFWECRSLTQITLLSESDSMKIGFNAFFGCSRLETIICHAAKPPEQHGSIFSGCDFEKLKIYVPDNLVAAYKSFDDGNLWYIYMKRGELFFPMSDYEGGH